MISAPATIERPRPADRITGWDWNNPPEVEKAFRVGYAIGASRCIDCSLDVADEFQERMHHRRGAIYWGELNIGIDRWSDRRAAVLRGAMQGACEAMRARARGVKCGLSAWADAMRTWASQDPVELDWSSAKPPDPTAPDTKPLRPTDLPRSLRWVMFGPPPVVQQKTVQIVTNVPKALITNLADVQPEQVKWLWPGRMALGKLTLLCGDPGLGKSFLTLDLAARVSAGMPWPDLPLLANSIGDVVLLSAEDDLADTIRPRLDAAGADPSRIIAIKAVQRSCAAQPVWFDLTQDLPALEHAIQCTANCRLVIIDPVSAYLGKTDSHNNAEVRAVLARLFELAVKHNVAVLAVTHLNKANTLPAIYRAIGSLAFVAAARASWAVVRDDQDSTGRRRLFVPVKNNLGLDDTGLAYSLEAVDHTARVAWEDGPVQLRADDALGGGGRKASAKEDATQFVIDTIVANGGDMLSDDLSLAAEANGISERTLRRAKQVVADSYKEKGPGGRWRCRVKDGQGHHSCELADMADMAALPPQG